MKKIIPLTVMAVLTVLLLQAQEVLRIKNNAVVSLQNGAVLSIAGGITLENTSTLINNGSITLIKNNSGGSSDWTDNTSNGYTYGSGSVLLNSNSGSNSHTLNSKNVFEHIDISAGAVLLSSDIQANSWTLINGPVTTGGFKAIVLSASATGLQAGASNINFSSSWFNGNIRRYVTPATVNSYTFPLGTATRSNPAVIDNLLARPITGTIYLDASFGAKPGTDAGLIITENGIPYSAVNDAGVWYITPDAEPAGGKYDLLLYLNEFTGLTDNQFGILRRPVASANAADWLVPPGSILPVAGIAGRIVSSGYARRNGISGFSQFGIGVSLNALPVSIIDFSARRISHAQVVLNWSTASEQNNKGFAIEKRSDNQTAFGQVDFVASLAASGNSTNQLQYFFTDNNSYTGISYYRLKQIDFDNHFIYTIIRAVSGSSNNSVTVKMYPNPNRGQFMIRIDGTTKTFNAIVTDAAGNTIKMFTVSGNSNVPVTGLAAGTYLLLVKDVFGNGESFAEKILIIR